MTSQARPAATATAARGVADGPSSASPPHRVPAVLRGAATAAVLAAAVLLAGCEPPGADSPAAAPEAGFELDRTNLRNGELPAGEPLRLRFTEDVDPGSLARHSVRIRRESGRPVRRLRVWGSGTEVFVAPAAGRSLPRGTLLVATVVGRPSPRALRATDGEVLRRDATVEFTVGPPRRLDLSGPRLIASTPADGMTDVVPGAPLSLTFSEPLARGSVRRGHAVQLHVDGVETKVRMRLSAGRTVLVLRPRRPLPANAHVVVSVRSSLLDTAGNPAERASIAFRTSGGRLRTLVEEFTDADALDPTGTTSAWAEPLTPGFLVARPGHVVASSAATLRTTDGRPPAASDGELRLLAVVPLDEPAPDGRAYGAEQRIVTAARLWLGGGEAARAADISGEVRAVLVDRVDVSPDDPWFAATVAAAAPVAAIDDSRVAASGDDQRYVALEVPFDRPIAVGDAPALLLEVRLVAPDLELAPLARLSVSGGRPRALSGWYDSGARRPDWSTALVEALGGDGLRSPTVLFQAAAANASGEPDLGRTSAWESRLEDLPGLRFVRFRIVFDGLGVGETPRVDRVVMPFEY